MPHTTTNSNVLYEYQAYDNFQLLWQHTSIYVLPKIRGS
jgi:hypothetical protein